MIQWIRTKMIHMKTELLAGDTPGTPLQKTAAKSF